MMYKSELTSLLFRDNPQRRYSIVVANRWNVIWTKNSPPIEAPSGACCPPHVEAGMQI